MPGVLVGKHYLETSDDANNPSSSQDPSTPPTKRSKVTPCRPNKVWHIDNDCLYIKHDFTDIMHMHRVYIQVVKR